MEQRQVECVMNVLSEWNPLGNAATSISDLDGYRTEAIDIIFAFSLSHGSLDDTAIVMDTLNQAFDLTLRPSECTVPAAKIRAVLAGQN